MAILLFFKKKRKREKIEREKNKTEREGGRKRKRSDLETYEKGKRVRQKENFSHDCFLQLMQKTQDVKFSGKKERKINREKKERL